MPSNGEEEKELTKQVDDYVNSLQKDEAEQLLRDWEEYKANNDKAKKPRLPFYYYVLEGKK